MDGIGSVRLIGVDTPESVDPRKPVEFFAKESSEFTRRMAVGKVARLEFDFQRKDKYDRTLAYVYLPDGTFLNAEIVKQGYGHAYTQYPLSTLDQFRGYSAKHASRCEGSGRARQGSAERFCAAIDRRGWRPDRLHHEERDKVSRCRMPFFRTQPDSHRSQERGQSWAVPHLQATCLEQSSDTHCRTESSCRSSESAAQTRVCVVRSVSGHHKTRHAVLAASSVRPELLLAALN